MTPSTTARLLAASALGVALGGVAAAAPGLAAPGDPDVDISVVIDEISTPGQLTMTVADNNGVTLTENGSNAAARQFTGVTPTVTVTDTRKPEEIPAGSFWAVVGQASQFVPTGGGAGFGPQYLGWSPRLLTGSTTGAVSPGEPVSSVISDGTGAPTVGLQGQELLVSTANAADETGSWDVNADLVLRTPVDVPAGEYHSTLTLSLFDQS
ncbi:hypothetical protein ACFFX1_00495 [Dactylosporangium sucinum]|uniref:WxL domain-containing protein n=1 Tax=Dactylosporangium sucinum TaxID=1424081 RepID=A0A917TFT9_9ACTN|nr:hypothetical protein [Dactylosporangium sucinum]GGM21388.1 hypothetical protein GCM10007977_023110 [Dactylosporangium sucinum]